MLIDYDMPDAMEGGVVNTIEKVRAPALFLSMRDPAPSTAVHPLLSMRAPRSLHGPPCSSRDASSCSFHDHP